MRYGIYVDDPPGIITRSYLDDLRGLGLDHVVLCIHDPSGRWWGTVDARRVQDRCEEAGIDPVLMTWPPLGGALGPHVAALEAREPRRWEADLEAQWRGEEGLKRRSALALVEAAVELGVVLDITSHAGHGELIEGGADVHDLLGPESMLWGQAYPLASRAAAEPELGLPRAVERMIARFRRITSPAQRGLILAAWDQSGFGDPVEAMLTAHRVASGYTPLRRWWSSKTVVGRKRNKYSAKAIARIIAGS